MSNFQCPHCGMTNIDCGRDGYKTPKEIELEAENEKLKKQVDRLYEQWNFSVKHKIILEVDCRKAEEKANKLTQCLDEIEEICKNNFCTFADGVCDGIGEDVLQKINEVKGNDENRARN